MKSLIPLLLLSLSIGTQATEDPRLAKPDVQKCVEAVKQFLRSSEYSGQDNEQTVIGACRDVDAKCVQVAGTSIGSAEAGQAATFLPIVRACRGRGTGQCLEAVFNTVSSNNRRTADQVRALLKKCE